MPDVPRVNIDRRGRPRRAPIHRRHDRHAEGRDADARQHLRERRADRRVAPSRARRRGEERYLLVIPYFHIYAFSVCMMAGMWIGALQIIHPEVRRRSRCSPRSATSGRPTFPAVPTVFVSLLNHPKVARVRPRAGAHVQQRRRAAARSKCIEEFERRIGRPLNEGYGLSETSPVTHSTPQLARRKPGTHRPAASRHRHEDRRLETGTRELPLGEAGELCIAGPQVMKGYWNKPDESAQRAAHGRDGRIWFHTGDIARMDEDGYTSIVQRKKDMIIVDGFNVYPSEVESVLFDASGGAGGRRHRRSGLLSRRGR